MSEELNLTKKQGEVLDYIRKYSEESDLTKNTIVNVFKDKSARMTVLSIIDFLHNNNLIKIDEINTKYHVVRPNNQHLLIKLENELDEFEEKYLILTEKLKYLVNSKNNERIDKRRRDNNIELAYYFYLLFQHLVGNYVMNMIFRWPDETKYKDEKILEKLFITLFKRLQKIYTSRKLFISPSEEIVTIPTLGQNLFILDKETIENMLKLCNENDIQQEAERVLDILWKISKQYFPFARPRFEKIPQPEEGFKPNNIIPDNWRDVIDYNKK